MSGNGHRPTKRGGRWWMLAVACCLGVGWVAAVEAVSSGVGPWLALPDASTAEIEERWKAAMALRGEPEEREGDALLLEALGKLREAPERECCKTTLRVLPEELAPEERAALELLLEWHRGGGTVVRPLCWSMGEGDVEAARDESAIGSLRLGHLALASSLGRGDVERVVAVWRLAEESRRKGAPVGVAVGYALRARVVGWFADQSLPLVREVDLGGARPEELYESLSWSAWCVERLRGPEPPFWLEARRSGDGRAEGPLVVPVVASRERQLRRYIVGRLLEPPFVGVAELKRREAVLREALPSRSTRLWMDAKLVLRAASQGTEELEKVLARLPAEAVEEDQTR